MIKTKNENSQFEKTIFLYCVIIYSLTILTYFLPYLKFLYLAISSILLYMTFYFCSHKISKQASVSVLLAATVPISFRNILGGAVIDFPVPWFYVIIMFIGIDAIIKTIKMKKIIKANWIVVLLFGVLLISYFSSINKLEATKEFLMLITIMVIFYWGNLNINIVDSYEYSIICNSYIYGIVFASLGVIAQYLFYTFFDITLFTIKIFGGGRVYLRFILGDMSGSTVYLASGVVILLLLKKKYSFILSLIIVSAMILSTSRAGLVALILTLGLYILTRKNNRDKWIVFFGFCILSYFLLVIMVKVRNNIASPTSSEYDVFRVLKANGRNEIIQSAFGLFKDNIIFGCGLDFSSQLRDLNIMTVHNATLMFLYQNGIIATVIAGFIFVKLLLKTLHTSIDQKWFMLVSIIGSCVSPSFLDMRFFTLLMLLVIIVKPTTEQNDNILSFFTTRKDVEY